MDIVFLAFILLIAFGGDVKFKVMVTPYLVHVVTEKQLKRLINEMYSISQRSPTPGLRTGTGPWVIWYRASQKE